MNQSLAPGFNSHTEGFDLEDNEMEDVIDEEELVKLKEVKDLRKRYRAAYKELKELKAETKYTQQGIDSNKEKLIASFEEWYGESFQTESEAKKKAEGGPRGGTRSPTVVSNEEKADEEEEDQEREGVDVDPHALAYIRSLKNVKKLNAARKDMIATGGK